MKRQIRTAMFESNSSSCHTLHICSKDEFEKWQKGEVVFDRWNEEFITPNDVTVEMQDLEEFYSRKHKDPYIKKFLELDEDAINQLRKEYIKDNELEADGETYDDWKNDDYLDTFAKRYTSEHGDEIVIFGKYGYDG